jgi:putative ABC transport system permease protein
MAHRTPAAGDLSEDSINMPSTAIFRALWRTPAGPLLLSAQVALSLMIFANVAYLIYVNLDTTERSTGMDLPNIFAITSQGYAKDYDQQSTTRVDLEYLNSVPGVVAASINNGMPQYLDALRSLVSVDPTSSEGKRFVIVYQSTEKIVETLGLQLVRGRMFAADTVLPPPSSAGVRPKAFGPEVVITEALADKLFGNGERALAFALQLSILLELPRIPVVFLVASMGLIWSAGLLAALVPALRGADIPPAVATRVA